MGEFEEKGRHTKVFMALIVFLMLLLPGFFAVPGARADDSMVSVVTTITILQDFAEEIGGSRVSAISLVTGNENPHTYATSTDDRIAVEDADIFIEFGAGLSGEMEPWAADLLESSDNTDMLVCEAAVNTTLIGDNPHVWMDPENAKIMVRNICESLITADPAGEDIYRNNTEAYIQKLDAMEQRIEEKMASHNGTKVIASHPAFLYLFHFLGFEQVDLLIDVPGQSPSAQRVAEIIDEIEEQDIPLFITMPQFSTPVVEQIKDETGITVVELTPLLGPFNTTTYIGMMEYDVSVIYDALTGNSTYVEESGSTSPLLYGALIFAGFAAAAVFLVYRRRDTD